MLAAELSSGDLAERVDVDAKSVGRWLAEDRVPHPTTRTRVARTLNQQETFLWPSLLEHPAAKEASLAEVERIWPTRSAVSAEAWHSLFSQAKARLDILVYAGGFLLETLDLADVIRWKAEGGTRVRILVGDPSSDAVRLRGDEENLPWIGQRCKTTIDYLASVSDIHGVNIRTHGTTLYASHFRFDATMLINSHSYGAWACQSPVHHLRRVTDGHLFGYYAQAFERVWAAGRTVR